LTIWHDTMTALYADPHMGTTALYKVAGVGSGTSVRVIRVIPDQIGTFGDTRTVSGTTSIRELRSAVATPAIDDTFTIDSSVYRVVAKPAALDSRAIEWTCEVRPA
jgi:hypothetical protein